MSAAGGPVETIETIRFPIEGMTCTSCVNRITRALRKLDGVEHVRVDLAGEAATVRRDPAIATDDALAAAVEKAGYRADLGAAVVVPADVGRGGDGGGPLGWLRRRLA